MPKRCDACKGRKEITGTGGMKKKCTSCAGVGYVADKVDGRLKKVDK